MNAIFSLDRERGLLFDEQGRRFDAQNRIWGKRRARVPGERVDAFAACAWLQRESGCPLRVPIGVIGPRDATEAQQHCAEMVGRGLARMGLAVVCGGRQGVMESVCRGVSSEGGLAIGMLPEADPSFANAHVGLIIATGIGEARNALIARASFCLVVIGDSYGTLSEVALGLQFGKKVVGLEGAASVAGLIQVASHEAALREVAQAVLAA
jgi:uncharacterized protein (TIGR00725 family)